MKERLRLGRAVFNYIRSLLIEFLRSRDVRFIVEPTSVMPNFNSDRRESLCIKSWKESSGSLPIMPPQLSILARATCSAASSSAQIPPFLLPFLQNQYRSASILSSLSDNPGAYNKNIRRGRGPASGKGKTSGRGHKGQKQHGKVPRDFEGGQTPLKIVHGERGFVNVYVAITHL